MIAQKTIVLPPFSQGMHLITDLIYNEIREILPEGNGLLHLFIKHTSAALTLNENADPSVRTDMENFIDELIPENIPYFTHTAEGPDDMPSHIKSSLFGASLIIPVTGGRLNLGTWQGIYLYEFRRYNKSRKIVATIIY